MEKLKNPLNNLCLMQKENKLKISKEDIQGLAVENIGRSLTSSEYKAVFEEIYEGIPAFVIEKINSFIDFNEMLKSNKGAEKRFPHFNVLNRNVNAFRKEFENFGVFKTEEDAHMFIDKDIVPFDEWKIVRVDGTGSEKEVFSVSR